MAIIHSCDFELSVEYHISQWKFSLVIVLTTF